MIARGRISLLAVQALALSAAGCLTASQESRVQTDLEDVRKQVFQMQKDTAAMASKMDAVTESLARQQSAGPTQFADLQAMIQSLADDVRRLGERINDNTSLINSLSRDVSAARDQYRGLEARLAASPSALSSYPGAPGGGTNTGTAPQSAPSGTSGPSAPGNAPVAGKGGPGTPPQPPPGPGSGSPGTQSGSPERNVAIAGVASPADEAAQEEAFRKPYAEYTRGSFDTAQSGFEEFLVRYPDSPLAGNAHYFSGECLFSQQRYQAAAEAFTKSIQASPNGEKTASAYLKKGLSLLALKQTAQGVVQLQHVIEAYPRSDEARIAADRLKQLGLRNH
jgi:tol-pal system protein YbgF